MTIWIEYIPLFLSLFLFIIGGLTIIFSYRAIKNNDKKSMIKLVHMWNRRSHRMTEDEITTFGIKLVLITGIFLIVGGIIFLLIQMV